MSLLHSSNWKRIDSDPHSVYVSLNSDGVWAVRVCGGDCVFMLMFAFSEGVQSTPWSCHVSPVPSVFTLGEIVTCGIADDRADTLFSGLMCQWLTVSLSLALRRCFQTAHFYVEDSSSPRVVPNDSIPVIPIPGKHQSEHCFCPHSTPEGG